MSISIPHVGGVGPNSALLGEIWHSTPDMRHPASGEPRMTGSTVWSSLTLQGSPELRDVLCCSQPYFINVDTEILMDEDVTHSDDT